MKRLKWNRKGGDKRQEAGGRSFPSPVSCLLIPILWLNHFILEFPSHLSVNAARDFQTARSRSKFRMLIVEKILPDDGNLQIIFVCPRQPHIAGNITRHVWVR